MLTVIENGNDENHKGREIKLPEDSKQHESHLLQQYPVANE